MSAVTQRFVLTVLTATEKNLFRFFRLVLYRCKRRGFVGTITERLFAAEAALAPEVTFTGLNFDAVRFFLANRRRIGHIVLQLCWSRNFAGQKEHEQETTVWWELS